MSGFQSLVVRLGGKIARVGLVCNIVFTIRNFGSFSMLKQGVGAFQRMRSDCRKGRVFFFVNKKEAKKTLVVWGCAGETARASDSESFLLLFFKKEALPLPSDVDCP